MRGSTIRCVRSQCKSQWGWRGQILHTRPSHTPGPISISLQIYHYVPQGVDLQNLVGIGSAVTFLRMREKTRFRVDFFLLTDLSIRFFVGATGHSFGAILMVDGSSGVFSQPLVPFGGLVVTSPHLGGKKPQKPQFWGLNRRFQAKLAK